LTSSNKSFDQRFDATCFPGWYSILSSCCGEQCWVLQDDAGSQHSQESESGSEESSYDSEAESASDSAEGTEADGASEDGSSGAVSLEVSS